MDENRELERRLRSLLDSGRFPPQSRLPTERALAERLDVSRWALRRALDRLAADGRIWRHVGRGTFAGARPPADDRNLALLCQHSSPSELIEARIMLEPAFAALVAVRATSAEIGAIRQAARRCAAARDMDAYESWDESFHNAIAGATRSVLLRSIFYGLNALRREIVWGAIKRSVLSPERRRFYSDQHAAIVAAIEERNAMAARAAMAAHLHALEALYLNIEQARLRHHADVSL